MKTNIKIINFKNENDELEKEIRVINANILLKEPEKQLINYLIKGPQNNNLQKLIPDGTRLNEIKIEKNCAIINFSNEILNYKDEKEKCVVDLIDYPDCFCLGRLDRDTTGLLILTNDKSLKKLLLPQNHVKKTYLVETKERLKKEDQEAFKRGIIIDQKIQCLPAKLEIIDDFHGEVTIEEGKYHQIKKMFLSLKNEVVSLKRISFDEILLDENLLEGMSRPLNKEERNKLIKKAAQY